MEQNGITNLEEYTPINSNATRRALVDSFNIDPTISGGLSAQEISGIVTKASKDNNGDPERTITEAKNKLAEYGYLDPVQFVPKETTDPVQVLDAYEKYRGGSKDITQVIAQINQAFPNISIKTDEGSAKE